MKKIIFLMFSTGLLFITGCASSTPLNEAPVQMKLSEATALQGQGFFSEKCGMCHRKNGMGTGILGRRMSPELALLENRDDLSTEFINVVVRNGFNTMFPISRIEVSNHELDTISLYLTD